MSEKLAKDHLNVVFLGHTDAGKSSAIGHLLYKLGEVDKRVVDRWDRESRDNARPNMKFAWVMDKLKSAREAGITQDLTMVKLETDKYSCTIIDVPGHRDYVSNMIAGTCQADCAVLVVNAFPGEFEQGITQQKFSKRIKDRPVERSDAPERHQRYHDQAQGQTREHALLSYYFGVRSLVVAVNKMDLVDWSQARFAEVQERLSKVLKGVGYDADKVPFVPISSWTGDCLVEASSREMGWYSGPSLMQALDALLPPARHVEQPLRLPISDVFKVGGIGTVPAGRVEYGVLKPAMDIVIAPVGLVVGVKSVEKHQETLQQAMAGDNVAFNLKGVSQQELRRGMVVSDAANRPALPARSFTARIVVLSHPTSIRVGYCPVIDVHTAHVSCKITKLVSRTPKGTRDTINDPLELLPGDRAMVELEPLHPLCVEPYSEYPQLGCFAIRDLSTTIAVGQVMEVVHDEMEQVVVRDEVQSNGYLH